MSDKVKITLIITTGLVVVLLALFGMAAFSPNMADAAEPPSGEFSISSPETGFRENQRWHLFDGGGATCHVEFWSVNGNRSKHDNWLWVADTSGQTTQMPVERFEGPTDRGLWDSTDTGVVFLGLNLGPEQVSSADYYAEWSCQEVPTSTTTPPTTTTSTPPSTPPSSTTSTTTSIPPDTTVTTAPPTTTVSTTSTTVPVTTTTDSVIVTTTIPGSSPSPSTVPPSIPTGVPTGFGSPPSRTNLWVPLIVSAIALVALVGSAFYAWWQNER